jgi:hypothetical protein
MHIEILIESLSAFRRAQSHHIILRHFLLISPANMSARDVNNNKAGRSEYVLALDASLSNMIMNSGNDSFCIYGGAGSKYERSAQPL